MHYERIQNAMEPAVTTYAMDYSLATPLENAAAFITAQCFTQDTFKMYPVGNVKFSIVRGGYTNHITLVSGTGTVDFNVSNDATFAALYDIICNALRLFNHLFLVMPF